MNFWLTATSTFPLFNSFNNVVLVSYGRRIICGLNIQTQWCQTAKWICNQHLSVNISLLYKLLPHYFIHMSKGVCLCTPTQTSSKYNHQQIFITKQRKTFKNLTYYHIHFRKSTYNRPTCQIAVLTFYIWHSDDEYLLLNSWRCHLNRMLFRYFKPCKIQHTLSNLQLFSQLCDKWLYNLNKTNNLHLICRFIMHRALWKILMHCFYLHT